MAFRRNDIYQFCDDYMVFNKGDMRYCNNEVKNFSVEECEDGYMINSIVIGNPDHTVSIKANNENDIEEYSCTCHYFNNYGNPCEHMVATLFEYADYCKRENTDEEVYKLMNKYSMVFANNVDRKNYETLASIESILEKDSRRRPFLSVKVGFSKKYIIKNLLEFKYNISDSSNVEYGKSLTLNHNINNFDDNSKMFIDFFLKYYSPELGVIDRYDNMYNKGKDKNFYLTEILLDQFFSMYSSINVKIDSKIATYNLVHTPPRFTINITKESRYFLISLETNVTEVFYGFDNVYIIKDTQIFVCDKSCKEIITPFIHTMFEKKSLGILEKDLKAFYANVLEPLKEFLDINTTYDLSTYRPLPLISKLYLDMPQKNTVTAELFFCYGDNKVCGILPRKMSDVGFLKEEVKTKFTVLKYFNVIDSKNKIAKFENNENMLFELLTNGLDELSSLCEIYTTDKFNNAKIVKNPVVNVGVKIESDLLNLTFDTDAFSLDELSEVLKSYKLNKKFHKLRNGSFMEIDNNSMGELLSLTQGLTLSDKELESGNITLPKYRALYLDNMIKQSQELKYERNQEFKKTVRDIKNIDDSDFEVPASLKKTLRHYQKAGFRWLKTMDTYNFGGILADDMGLGKTLQVISLFLDYYQNKGKLPSIVICPASLILNWENEITKFAPTLKTCPIMGTGMQRKALIEDYKKYNILITSYDLLKRDTKNYEKVKFAYEIVDEAQFIKNQNTQNAKGVKLIKARQKFALTGTPVENSLAELWSIFDFLIPNYLYNYHKFKETFETPIVKNKDEEVLENLKKMVSPFILRRLKKAVLKELPDKTETVLYAKLEDEQEKLYIANVAKMKKDLQQTFETEEFNKNKFMVLAMLTRLRQLCCDPSLMYEDYKGESAKTQMCIDLVESCVQSGHKILLFSQFTSMLAILEENLNKLNIKYYKIQGSTNKELRMDLVNKFNTDDTPVFLISLKAGGTGLNLTGADVVIHYDPWWNISAQNQATDRAHRIGQKNSVTVYKLIAKNTIEEKILKLQNDKAELADMIINENGNIISKMTKDDLLNLFED